MRRPDDYVTVKEAAEIKGVLEGTVRRRIQRERLPATKKGDIYLIRRKDLEGWKVRKNAEDTVS